MTNKQITIIEKRIGPVLEQAKSIKITDKQSLEDASILRSQIKTAIDFVSTDKEKIYRPIKDALDEVNNRYKQYEKQLDEALKALNTGMTRYTTSLLEAQKAQEAKIAKEMTKGKLSVETALEKLSGVERVENTDLTGFVNMPELVIDNIAKIPREFLIPDEKKIREALKNGIKVPGATMKDRLVPKTK